MIFFLTPHPIPSYTVRVYGILVWPPEGLEGFLSGLQSRHRVKGFGRPHLNLRQPFEWEHSEESLKIAIEGVLRSHAPLRLKLGGWSSFEQGVVYLRAYGGRPFQKLYRALEPLASPLREIEGPSYIPHLTLALGLSKDQADTLAQALPKPPIGSFMLREVVLVKDTAEGELVEAGRFELSG
jgi:2'-5' RNA ligase